MNEQVEFATICDRDKHLYDLRGFRVIGNFLTPEKVNALNESVDANLHKGRDMISLNLVNWE